MKKSPASPPFVVFAGQIPPAAIPANRHLYNIGTGKLHK